MCWPNCVLGSGGGGGTGALVPEDALPVFLKSNHMKQCGA